MGTFFTTIYCTYSFMGFHFADVELTRMKDGSLYNQALVKSQGNQHQESFAAEVPAENEVIHGWLSKESSENSIEMIIYKEARSEGNSKLVNHRMPVGQDVWGTCQGF